MRSFEITPAVRTSAIFVACLFAIAWVSHVGSFFIHSWPFIIQGSSWPWYVFPSVVLLITFSVIVLLFPAFNSSLGFTLSSIVGLPMLVYFAYLVPSRIYSWVHPPLWSSGIAEVAYDFAYTTNPLKVVEAFAVLMLSVSALLSRRAYTRPQLLLLLLYWTSGVVQLFFIAWAWCDLQLLPFRAQ